MARKTKAEKHEIILRKLESSARWRDEMGYDSLWERMIDLYRGKHWPETTMTRDDLVAVVLGHCLPRYRSVIRCHKES